jgi:hypothetical protein
VRRRSSFWLVDVGFEVDAVLCGALLQGARQLGGILQYAFRPPLLLSQLLAHARLCTRATGVPTFLVTATGCSCGFVRPFSLTHTLSLPTPTPVCRIPAPPRYELSYNQEIRGLGFANFAGALFSSYTTTGSFSRSAVNNSSGEAREGGGGGWGGRGGARQKQGGREVVGWQAVCLCTASHT